MSRQIQIRRGTATEHANFTGAIGEITMDTTNKTLRVHDGTTAGGVPLARADEIPAEQTIPDNYDFVVECQVPSSSNNYTWYRKYKSGWIEQGGQISGSSSVTKPVTLPVNMANANYCVSVVIDSYSANATYSLAIKNRQTTGFDIGSWYGSGSGLASGKLIWSVKGMATE